MRRLSLVRTEKTERNEVLEEKHKAECNRTERTEQGSKLETAQENGVGRGPLCPKPAAAGQGTAEDVLGLLWVKNEVPQLFQGDAVYLWNSWPLRSTITDSSNKRNAVCASRRNCSRTKATPF